MLSVTADEKDRDAEEEDQSRTGGGVLRPLAGLESATWTVEEEGSDMAAAAAVEAELADHDRAEEGLGEAVAVAEGVRYELLKKQNCCVVTTTESC
jgi:hypothetical protein